VTPLLYRENAFRVLGLSTVVEGAEATRRQKRLRMLEKVGATTPRSPAGVLPLKPPPDSDAIRRAGHRLHDMQSRLVDELFWFWPMSSARADGDEGYELLEAGDIAGAHRAWSSVQPDEEDWPAAIHNLAVLNHAMALDIERATATEGSLGNKVDSLRDQYWASALESWVTCIDDERTWAYLDLRAEALDDRRLPSFVCRFRKALPAALLRINVLLAIRAARAKDAAGATRHGGYVRASGFNPHMAVRMIEHELSPLIDQLHRICDPIPARSDAVPSEGASLAHGVIRDCDQLLECISVLSGTRHHSTQTACDLVASTVRRCTIDYGNATGDWDECAELLDKSVKLALGQGLRARLEEDIAKVKQIRNEAQRRRAEEQREREAAQRRRDEAQRKREEEQRKQEKLKKAVTADRVYEVTISSFSNVAVAQTYTDWVMLANNGGALRRDTVSTPQMGQGETGLSASVPNACTCCLEAPDGQQSVRREWEETLGDTRYRRSLSFSFPVCSACLHHQSDYVSRRTALVVLSVIASTIAFFFLVRELQELNWFALLLIGGMFTTALVCVLAALMGFRALSEQHACRGPAVEMSAATKNSATFRFHNPLYAHAFAEANGASVREREVSKPTRGSYILAGQGTVLLTCVTILLGGLVHFFVYAVTDGHWEPRSRPLPRHATPISTREDPTPPPSSPTRKERPARSTTPRRTYTGLSSKIASGKARVRRLEAELSQMKGVLQSSKTSLEELRQDIDQYESQMRSGYRVNRDLYQRTVDLHNRLVRQYNSDLSAYKTKYTEYEQEFDSVNDMVERYNRGER